MDAHILTGLLGFLSFACVLAGGFFIHAWQERRSDREYLLFGISNLAMASYSLLLGWAYLRAARGVPAAQVLHLMNGAVVSGIAAVALLLHFGLLHARLRFTRQAAIAGYALGVGFALAVLTSNWWVGDLVLSVAQVGPWTLPQAKLQVGWIGKAFFLAAPLALGAAGALFGLGQRRVKGPLGVVWGSAALLVVAGINDCWGLGAGTFATLPLLPFGFSGFGLAVSLTLVSRYGRLAAALELRTSELNARSEELSASLEDLSQTRWALVKTRQLAQVGGLIEELAEELSDPLDRAQCELAALDDETGNDADLDNLERETARINRLVSDLLSFARPIALNRERVDLEPVIKQGLALTEAYPEVDVEVACQLPWPQIDADADRLRQVFEHLVHNALAAVRDEGELSVRVLVTQHNGRPHVQVEVQDTGEGMTEADLRRALAPFFTTREDGTGFGLPICKRIVETHGGELFVDSELNVGTTVRMLLPVDAPPSVSTQLRPLSSIPGGEF